MSLAPGDRLGAYEIVGRIGAGGMGEVYRARDTRLDRTVAIKVLSDAVASDSDLRQRFEREARAVAALNHPHICVLHDVGHHNGSEFLVMEFLDGESLSDRLRQGPLPFDQVFRYAIQIAQALGRAHLHGITHRDIKPGNIMLSKSGAKLLDFGLAKVVEGPAINELTRPPSDQTAAGMILGTPQYMAPEQLRGGPIDGRADVFAFGAVLYEMVSGVRAFSGSDTASVIAATIASDPPPLKGLRPDVPSALARLIAQCLAKTPEDRWQSIRDVELELEWIRQLPSLSVDLGSHGVSSRLAWATAAFAVAVATVMAFVNGSTPTAIATLNARFDVATPFTSEPASFAISPDGRQMVYTGQSDRTQRLWLRQLDQFTSQPLGGTDGGIDPFWSPDASSIAFFADGKLKRVDLRGGTPQVLADAPTARGGTWSPDGQTILFTPTTVSPLLRVPAAGGTPRSATSLVTGQNSHRWPQFLPDGHRFLFLSTFGDPSTQGVFMGSLDGGDIKRVLADNSPAAFAAPSSLLLVRQGALVALNFDARTGQVSGEPTQIEPLVGLDASLIRSAFAVSPSGVLAFRSSTAPPRQLTWIDRAGRVTATVGEPDFGAPASPDLTRDGKRVVVFRTQQGNADVWQIPVGTGVPSRITFDPAADVSPMWSQDGQRILFSSARIGPVSLFEHSMSGGLERPLDPAPESRIVNAFSPDGRHLIYTALSQNSGVDLWVLPMDGGKAFPVLQTPYDEMAAQISPNGRWIAYQSNATGRIEIYVTSFPSAGAQQQVSSAGGGQARWSMDGRELFYVSADNQMMALPVTNAGGAELDLGTPSRLFQVRIATGTNIPGAVGTRPQYAVAPDGRFLINAAIDGAPMPPISVILDWRSSQKQ